MVNRRWWNLSGTPSRDGPRGGPGSRLVLEALAGSLRDGEMHTFPVSCICQNCQAMSLDTRTAAARVCSQAEKCGA